MRLMSWIRDRLQAGRLTLFEGPPPEEDDADQHELRHELLERMRVLSEHEALIRGPHPFKDKR